MNTRTLALAISVIFSASLHAEETPLPGKADARVQHVVYDANNVVRVLGTQLRSTLIQFGPTESIVLVAIGDRNAWAWQKSKNLLFIKPSIDPARDSNMQVVTLLQSGQQRIYQFALVGQPDTAVDPVYGINFTYPGDVAAARRRAYEERRKEIGSALARQRLKVDLFYGARNWDYVGRGSPAIAPYQVSDNGETTVFRFPGNTKLPAIYELTPDGHEQISSSTVTNDLVVVHDTAPGWVLRLGSAVYDVWNIGYNPVGFNPRTGTVSPEVVRSVDRPVDRRDEP
jgi:type IV secretion system protein VirB9